MPTCETCGNSYATPLRILGADGRERIFDSFECAIHAMAPRCAHCDMRIIGHGVEQAGRIFCCNHCAERSKGSASAGSQQDMTQATGSNVRSSDPAHGQQPSP